MDYVHVSSTKGADCFVFDYSYLDVVYSVALGSGDWGLYKADGTIVVGQTIAPQIGTDGVTSQAGTFTTSISLAHLTSYTTARVHWEGSGFTLSYTVDNGTTWTNLSEDGVITLPANADLDLKVSFPGNIQNDPAVLTSLTVYILGTETMKSMKGVRTLNLFNAPLTSDGLVFGQTSGTIPAPNAGQADYSIGTIEMFVNPTTNSVFANAPAGTLYTNGVVGSPLAGIVQHVVLVLTTPANVEIDLAPTMTVSHLALYSQAMTASDVTLLYDLQTTGYQTVTVNDPSTISVTEYSPTTDIYAYAWQIQSGGS